MQSYFTAVMLLATSQTEYRNLLKHGNQNNTQLVQLFKGTVPFLEELFLIIASRLLKFYTHM